jgi:hypothetical protein
MKKLYNIFSMVLLSMLFLTACQDDDNELGLLLDKSAIDFEVTQDYSIDEGGNTVILKNLTPETVAMWDYGTGRSTRATDTVRFPFKGEYTIKFSALTAGGIVPMDPITIQVTEDNLMYVSDPLWILLSGGPGKEKSWVLDTEAKFFNGPITFLNPDNFDEVWWDPGLGDVYPSVMAEGDYGVMTFNLKGGPFFSAVKPMEGGIEEEGTYFLNVNSNRLTINNASILRGYKPDKNGITGISDWMNYDVIALDENTLRLGVLRDRDVDGEGPAILVYNFISKEYSDNYVPEVEEPSGPDEGFDPEFAPGELLNMLTGGPSSGRLWKLDAEGNPIDWLASGIGWTTSSDDSRDWGWNASWDAVASNSWILFDQIGGQNYTRNQSGVVTTGTFTINEETNEITLEGNTLIQNSDPKNWMNPTTNTIKVVKAFPGEAESKGIWFGTSYNADKDEWFAFHYIIPQE